MAKRNSKRNNQSKPTPKPADEKVEDKPAEVPEVPKEVEVESKPAEVVDEAPKADDIVYKNQAGEVIDGDEEVPDEAPKKKPATDFIKLAMRLENVTADGLSLQAPKVMHFDDRVTVNLYGKFSGKRVVHFFRPESGGKWKVHRATVDETTTIEI